MSQEARTARASNYDKVPTIQVSDDDSACSIGWAAIAQELRKRITGSERKVIVVECYPGVDVEEVRAGLAGLFADDVTAISAERALKFPGELAVLLAPWLGDDPVFGRMKEWRLASFFDSDRTAQIRCEMAKAGGAVLLYGTGASYLARQWDLLVYCDVTRWEIQQRQRAHRVGNLGTDNSSASPAELYKRSYFVDWRAADAEKHHLHSAIDFYIDTNIAHRPAMISGRSYRGALAMAVRRPFRVVPFFDPGPWGGEWMRRHFDLPKDAPNFAWCFDCVPEENSVRFGFGDRVIEAPSLALVHEHPQELLGTEILSRFGAEFPIRFDFLDTVEGGNLSLQVHPLRSYITEHFGMAYTQDESYYLLDAGPDAFVYLGLKPEIDRSRMEQELEEAQTGGPPFAAEKYVNAWPAKKHDHFSIPAGTIHCSGRNSMVLEISATPYIFTFKLWDWARLGLNDLPRPIHLKHGLANIQWNRDREWVAKNLVSPVREIACGEGWREEATGLHELEFLETRRHWFTVPVEHDTAGTLNVLNLVEGEEVVVESPKNAFAPFVVHYAETFIVPAWVGRYRISPAKNVNKPLATIKAFVRSER
ncbi:MAG TPA: class I mannose-6-phosphate isomerase [Terracidiphilus sp.]|nr:class I mannose-6-phosphate isomerase [Terracidiphilus sp.]